MPKVGKQFFHRNITVDDERWEAVKEFAEENDLSISGVFRAFIDRMILKREPEDI